MATPKTQPEEWLPKHAAAKFLGLSHRQLERRAFDGYIAKRFLPRKPTDTSQKVEYKVEDLIALKDGVPNMSAVVRKPKAAPAVPEETAQAVVRRSETAQPAALAVRETPRDSAWMKSFATLFERLQAPVVKPWLTVAEAVEYSGLPAAWLIEQARAGLVRAVNVGHGTREHWRFNREALAK